MSALLLSADLLATSKLGGAAQRASCPLQIASSATGIVQRLTAAPAGLVVVDLGTMRLDLPGLVAELRSLPVPPAIIAFGPHVHEDRLQAARCRLRLGLIAWSVSRPSRDDLRPVRRLALSAARADNSSAFGHQPSGYRLRTRDYGPRTS